MDGLIAYALSKKYVDGKTSSLATGMSWKGTKENVSSLPQSGNQIGDLWHVNENGNEYAWDGSKWEALGGLDKSFTETDPTVPEWAKQPQKPTYTAAEVGALSSDTLIPPTVTETTVSQWGFTKNTGTYSKPSGGIPKTDLAETVQTSLGKADTALQSHQSLSGYATEQWVENKGYLAQHQSLAAYRTASAQDTIDNAQNTEIAKKANIADLAAVATSGSYNDLTDKPTIPSLTGYATQAWVNNKGYLTLADLPVYNGGVA